MATSDRWTDPSSGERKERTEWHRIVVWGKQAEIVGEYLRKGRQVYIEGALQTREWTDRDGNKRYTTEVRAQRVQMLGSRADSVDSADSGEPSGGTGAVVAESDPGYQDDDVPF